MPENKAYQMNELSGSGEKKSHPGYVENISSAKEQTSRKTYILRSVAFVIWIAVFEAVGAVIGIFFGAGDWYDTINKPSVTPPGVVFAIVWPILYLMLAIFGWWISYGLRNKQMRVIFSVFIIQMIGNWVWSPVFQYYHEIWAGLVIISILIVLNLYVFVHMLVLNVKIMKVHTRYLALILMPYIGWCCFATYLNAYIAVNN